MQNSSTYLYGNTLPCEYIRALNERLSNALKDFGGKKPQIKEVTATVYGTSTEDAYLFVEFLLESDCQIKTFCTPLPYSNSPETRNKSLVNWEWRTEHDETSSKANRLALTEICEYFRTLARLLVFKETGMSVTDSLA